MFRNTIDEKIKERRFIVRSKDIKEKKVHIDSIRFNSTKLVHLKKIVTRIDSLRFMYVVVCSIVNVMVENIRIKTMFNSEAEVNCIFK